MCISAPSRTTFPPATQGIEKIGAIEKTPFVIETDRDSENPGQFKEKAAITNVSFKGARKP